MLVGRLQPRTPLHYSAAISICRNGDGTFPLATVNWPRGLAGSRGYVELVEPYIKALHQGYSPVDGPETELWLQPV